MQGILNRHIGLQQNHVYELSQILQLANHCSKALNKETLLLMHPLGNSECILAYLCK